VGENPTRQSLQPEVIGAVMEVTKWLKPSISVSRIGDSASVQAATRVNVEQASTTCAHVEPTVVRFAPRQTRRPPEGGLSIGKRASYIFSWVFFIFSDLVIFFLLTLSFDISPLDMLSLWAAGPVVGGLVVSVD